MRGWTFKAALAAFLIAGVSHTAVAQVAISALPAGTAIVGTEVAPFVQGGVTVKTTADQIKTFTSATPTLTGLTTMTVGAANTGMLASTGYSLTGSDATSMVDLAGTWNTTGTPTAIDLSITDTASNAASLLMHLKIGASSRLSLSKAGVLKLNGANTATLTVSNNFFLGYAGSTGFNGGFTEGLGLQFTGVIQWSSNTPAFDGPDLKLYRDAANTLAQRNGTTAQTSRLYTTWTDASNGEWLEFGSASSVPYIAATKNGTGTFRSLTLNAGGATVLTLNSSSQTLFADGTAGLPSISFATDPDLGFYQQSAGVIEFVSAGAARMMAFSSNKIGMRAAVILTWASGINPSAAGDLFVRRDAAASLALGDVDAASPVAQTLGVQGVVAGTSNAAGAAWTLAGSQGTGTGTGGAIDFQTAPAGGSGSTQNALVTALSITGEGLIVMPVLPTSEPATVGALWSNAGVLTVSDGP